MAAFTAVILQTASADVLLTDNFIVSSNSENPNQQIASRQAGLFAPVLYTFSGSQTQVGNPGTDVGQPGGAANSAYLLLAFGSYCLSDLPIDAAASGPITIACDLYANDPGYGPDQGGNGDWICLALEPPGGPGNGNPPFWPVCGSGQFGMLCRGDGGLHLWSGGNDITPNGWDSAGFTTSTSFSFTFSDSTGTNSAFAGNGSEVTISNGGALVATLALDQLQSTGLRFGFYGQGIEGVGNLLVSGTPGTLQPPGQNLSFEWDTTPPGTSITIVPTSWTAFNQAGTGDFGSQNAGGTDFSVFDPLSAPATGNQYCYLNVFSGAPTGGIYQDMGPLQPNTVYTLTVAIGSRADRINSPGIISLVNGTDETGTVLAAGGGLPATQDTWQDYSTTFFTGASVSGDITVMLSVLGSTNIQADFDNVILNAQQSLIPLPDMLTNITPVNPTVGSGDTVAFTVAFGTSPPIALQWQQVVAGSPNVTNNISNGVVTVTNDGVIISTLTLTNVQLSAAASYQVEVANATNLATVVYTAASALTVIPGIQWYAAGTYDGAFSNNTVLTYAGSTANEVYGVDFGGSGAQTTANGYTFADYQATGNMSIAGSVGSVGGYLVAGATTGDGALDAILTDGVYGGTANTGSLNNLTIGQTYTVMVLLDDTRGSAADGTYFYVTDGVDVSPSQQYAYANGAPAIGGYIMGIFTAVATSQPLSVVNNGGSQYNAILLETGVAPPPPVSPTLTSSISPVFSEVPVGASMSFSVAGQGSLPLSYQWANQSGPIAGATNASYTFNALAGSNTYTGTISNAFGSVSSSAVVVGGTNAPPSVTLNNGTNWTLNNDSAVLGVTLVVPDFPRAEELSLTDLNGGEATSGFYNAAQYIGGFVASFSYFTSGGADGITFCVQNASNGPNALGLSGGNLGFGGMAHSAAFEMNIYAGHGTGTGPGTVANTPSGIALGTNGATPYSAIPCDGYYATGSVSNTVNNPIYVQLYYMNGVMQVLMIDSASNQFITNITADLPGAIGGNAAYVGFTGATGGVNSDQSVENFLFTYSTPPVLSIVTGAGGNVVISWPVSVSSLFNLMQSSSVQGPWVSATPTSSGIVGLQNQATFSAGSTASFYKLQLVDPNAP